jgi:hypothetical protein
MNTDPAFDEKAIAMVEEYRRQQERERIAWNKANRTAIKTLRTKLLSIGGDRISPQPHPDIRILAKHGILMEFPVILRMGEPNRCHENVAWLWKSRGPRSRLIGMAIGYALTADGMWRPHSWALSKTKGVVSIIETTVERTQYFGVGRVEKAKTINENKQTTEIMKWTTEKARSKQANRNRMRSRTKRTRE